MSKALIKSIKQTIIPELNELFNVNNFQYKTGKISGREYHAIVQVEGISSQTVVLKHAYIESLYQQCAGLVSVSKVRYIKTVN